MPSGRSYAKNWCWTLNNPQRGDLSLMVADLYSYLIYGDEVGADGTPHYQGYVMMKKPYTLVGMKKLIPRAHFEVAKGTPQQASEYCKKDGSFIEDGNLPAKYGNQGKRSDLEEFALAIKEKDNKELYESYPSRYLLYCRNVDKVRMVIQDPPQDLTERCGIWFTGPPKSGKSMRARKFGSFYEKNCNKWWDGYNNEDIIIIDDIDQSHEWMAHYLKIWADIYPFIAEIKGGTIKIRPKKIIVTSNHNIDEIFKNLSDYAAILSRFEVVVTTHDPNYKDEPQYAEHSAHSEEEKNNESIDLDDL